MKLSHLFEDRDTADIMIKQVQRLIAAADPYTGKGGKPLHVYIDRTGRKWAAAGRVFRCLAIADGIRHDDRNIWLYYIPAGGVERAIKAYDKTSDLVGDEAHNVNLSYDEMSRAQLELQDDHWVLRYVDKEAVAE